MLNICLTFLIKKVLGLQVGDPNVPNSLKKTLFLLNQHFHKLNKKLELQKNLIEEDQFIDYHYLKQQGIKISDNVEIKIKPFAYGKRINQIEFQEGIKG